MSSFALQENASLHSFWLTDHDFSAQLCLSLSFMGTGASATIAETAKSVSDDDLKASFKDVSAADRMRIGSGCS